MPLTCAFAPILTWKKEQNAFELLLRLFKPTSVKPPALDPCTSPGAAPPLDPRTAARRKECSSWVQAPAQRRRGQVRRWPRPWTSEREQRADLRRKRGRGVEAGALVAQWRGRESRVGRLHGARHLVSLPSECGSWETEEPPAPDLVVHVPPASRQGVRMHDSAGRQARSRRAQTRSASWGRDRERRGGRRRIWGEKSGGASEVRCGRARRSE